MTTTTEPARATTSVRASLRDYAQPLWRRLVLSPEAGITALLILVIIAATVAVPHFGTTTTWGFLLLDAAPILMIALPMTLVIVTGEIDLSVASVIGMSSVVFGLLVRAGTPVPLAGLACIVVGLLAGAFNGFFVTVVGLPSLAVTIGTLALFRGIAVGLLGTQAITTFPADWQSLAQLRLGASGIPAIMLVVLVLAVGFFLLLHFTTFGRSLFALGLNKEAAHFSGVRVGRGKFSAFLMTGAVSALAGVFWTLRFGSARGDNANGLELTIIAAVLLGGVSIFGGKGSIPGAIAGVILVAVLQSALRLAGVNSDAINVVTGALLVLSVLAPRILAWLRGAFKPRAAPR